VARRSGSLQSSNIILFEPNRRRNQARHTLTIHEPTPEHNQAAATPLARALARSLLREDRGRAGPLAAVAACASLECVHDLQFKIPAFMGPQDRRKVLDLQRDPVDDQYYAGSAVRRDSSAQPVVQHSIRAG